MRLLGDSYLVLLSNLLVLFPQMMALVSHKGISYTVIHMYKYIYVYPFERNQMILCPMMVVILDDMSLALYVICLHAHESR